MNTHLLLEEMTREEVRQIAQYTLVVLPTGAIEQHGPHLPVGTDWLTVQHLARAAASEAARSISIVVAPTLPFGSSHHHLPFGGTLSLSTDTYYRVVSELCESLIVGGFRSIFVLNGHGGNHELVQLAIRDLALKHPCRLAAASYWSIAWDALVEAGAHKRGNLPGHAGRFETSQILALRPELVHEPRPHRDSVKDSDPRSFCGPYRTEVHGSWQQIDGYSDSPDLGSAADGQSYLSTAIRSIAKSLIEFHKAST